MDYTIFEYDYGTLYTKQEIKVYSTPHAMGELLGKIAGGKEVYVTARCIENDWVRVVYNGMEGYAPARYIGMSAPENVSLTSDEVMVPDVYGMTEDEAEKILKESGLKVANYSIIEDSITYAAGTVASTEPAYGTVVKKNSTVALGISWGAMLWNAPNITLPTEASTDVSIVKRTLLERSAGKVDDFFGAFIAEYYETVELEYSDGTVLRVKYRMNDVEIEEIREVEVVKLSNSSQAAVPKLTKECYDLLKMKHTYTYPLGYTLLFYGGEERTPFGNWEYLVEFGDDGRYIVVKNGNTIFSELTNYDAVEPIYGPLFWASDVVKTTEPINSYESDGDTYAVYEDATTVRYHSDGMRVDVTRADNSGYSVFFRIRNRKNTISKVTFYDSNREELYTIHRRISVEPYICLWYRYVGENQVQIVNTDGTPVERFKDTIFDAEAAFTNNNGAGAALSMLKTRTVETSEYEIYVETYVFTVKTMDGEYIELYQHEFPLEDY